jgi:flagellar biosynthesis component FlhA
MATKALPAPRKPLITLAALGDLVVPIAVLAIVMALITPMPGFLLDILIVTDVMLFVSI